MIYFFRSYLFDSQDAMHISCNNTDISLTLVFAISFFLFPPLSHLCFNQLSRATNYTSETCFSQAIIILYHLVLLISCYKQTWRVLVLLKGTCVCVSCVVLQAKCGYILCDNKKISTSANQFKSQALNLYVIRSSPLLNLFFYQNSINHHVIR